MTTFYSWLKQFKRQENAIGDLARDLIQDRREDCLPKYANVKTIRDHIIHFHGGINDAVDTLDRAYVTWEKQNK